MTAEGLHGVHCSSALLTYASLATLLNTMRNTHMWSPLVSAEGWKFGGDKELLNFHHSQ